MNQEQSFLLLMIAVSAVMTTVIVLPFLEYIIVAVIVAHMLYPFHRRLAPRVGQRLSPAILVFVSVLVVFLPVLYVASVLTRNVLTLSQEGFGPEFIRVETAIADLTGQHIDLSEAAATAGQELLRILFGDIARVVSISTTFLIGVSLTLFLVYYLLKDGEAFVNWLIMRAPVSRPVCERLIERVHWTTRGVLVSHFLVSILQGLVGGLGLLIVGIPNVVFWTFVMILLGVLPLIGAFLVWAPAAIYLVSTGRVGWGVFLIVYGVVVVGMIDNYVRPLVIDRQGAHLNPGIVLIGVFGGVFAIGFTGLFVGPLVLAVLTAMIVAFDEEYDDLRTSGS